MVFRLRKKQLTATQNLADTYELINSAQSGRPYFHRGRAIGFYGT